jgi:hypothetical protein
MYRILILVAAGLSLFCSSGAADAGQAHKQMKYQKITTCKAKIESKGLKGSAFKAEMQKCTINPDNYS